MLLDRIANNPCSSIEPKQVTQLRNLSSTLLTIKMWRRPYTWPFATKEGSIILDCFLNNCSLERSDWGMEPRKDEWLNPNPVPKWSLECIVETCHGRSLHLNVFPCKHTARGKISGLSSVFSSGPCNISPSCLSGSQATTDDQNMQ